MDPDLPDTILADWIEDIAPAPPGEQPSPIVRSEGGAYSLKDMPERVPGRLAFVASTNAKTLPTVCAALRPEKAFFGEIRADDLSPLADLQGVKELHLAWAPKVVDLAPLTALTSLETLVIRDCAKLRDLTPLADMRWLKALEIAGGPGGKMTVESLAPLGSLTSLETFIATYVTVRDPEGLRPLAGCKALKHLTVPYNLPVEGYPYLMAHLPDTVCNAFRPYVHLGQLEYDKDIMVVGKRRPFLNESKDAAKLARYVAEFEDMLAKYRAEAG